MAGGEFHYHFLAADLTVQRVAERFYTTPSAIYEATRARDPQGFPPERAWRPAPDTYLWIPIPDDSKACLNVDWTRVPVSAAYATLGALVEAIDPQNPNNATSRILQLV